MFATIPSKLLFFFYPELNLRCNEPNPLSFWHSGNSLFFLISTSPKGEKKQALIETLAWTIVAPTLYTAGHPFHFFLSCFSQSKQQGITSDYFLSCYLRRSLQCTEIPTINFKKRTCEISHWVVLWKKCICLWTTSWTAYILFYVAAF